MADQAAYAPAPLPAPPEQSLFASDATVLSDQDIARILDYTYVPPDKSRIAIISLAPSYAYWSGDFAKATEELQVNFVTQLRSASVSTASFLPTFLIPEKRTVGLLREAAARYQADLLLVYRTSCRTYEKYRLLANDETKAYCTVEGAILDVRTGIVPFTSVASRDVSAVKEAGDTNFQETVRRAELLAVGEGLTEVARRVVQFLERQPGR